MAESGSTEQQIEFILDSQKTLKIPDDEPIWSLSSSQSHEENDQELLMDFISTETDKLKSPPSISKKKKGSLCWPPVGWKTAPGFDYGFLSKGVTTTDQGWNEGDTSENTREVAAGTEAEVSEDYIMEDDILPEAVSFPDSLNIPEITRVSRDQLDSTPEHLQPYRKSMDVPTNVVIESHCPEDCSPKPNELSTPDGQQAAFTGRLGELIAFRHLKGKHGTSLVKWMNEQKESGLPYDIVIGEKGADREFMEVKATRYASKRWFKMSTREWQFAVEKGDSYSIAHVVLSNTNTANIVIFKNPVKLCQLGKLDLAVMMPRNPQPGPSAAPAPQ